MFRLDPLNGLYLLMCPSLMSTDLISYSCEISTYKNELFKGYLHSLYGFNYKINQILINKCLVSSMVNL